MAMLMSNDDDDDEMQAELPALNLEQP